MAWASSTRLFSAVLLGPIYISLALLSGEGLRDRQGEATQWSNIISDVLTPPSHKTNVSYSDAIDNGDDEGYVNEGNLLGEDGQGGRLRYSGPSPAEQWHAHVERFFTMGAHHLGLYFRTEEITDHGSLPVSSDTAAEYVPKITTRLISVQDDLPPAAQNHDRDNGGGGGGPNPKGRFVLAQIAFNDVGEDDDPNDPDAVRPERDMNRTGQCASAVINDLERRLHQLGASRALLLTLDEGTYHTVYWDGRRFVTLLFLEFTPPPSH
ncbi:uncharacterized protein B0I36DRAFT_361015 [Microdochium trichocladiopsis]|uniref:Uncharacterized protein n=1 Tax=Microdochium trichocladiopsis TaxID=1682393 RepID=A0A9P8YD01_9PEZI|nr:uncharacterized protein B0I36DRAFT_361015 [Microdochium trichocladiopsis]KAH7035680.1 hypothetical protein B0I36DRAFT_361015 [Microdochium trichocladiopsis]